MLQNYLSLTYFIGAMWKVDKIQIGMLSTLNPENIFEYDLL